jgi:hypothetical protein
VSQILHIIRKDVRRHWPEILVSLALLVVFVWYQPRKWTGQVISVRFVGSMLNALPALMVLSWAFLIARLVQGESLVGDRQFWITRPYDWYKLFAAKLLAILLLLHVPLLIGQLVLLRMGNFPLISSLPGLIQIHFMFFVILVLPSVALAAVTSGIGQAALALLILFLLLLGIAGIGSLVPNSGMSDDVDGVQAILFLATSVTVITIQYGYRKAVLARLLIAGALIAGVLILVLTPYETMVRHDYPLPTNDHPLPAQLTFDRTLTFAHEGGRTSRWVGDEVEIEMPFQVQGLGDKSVVQLHAVKLDLVLPSGERWSSHWHVVSGVISYGRTRVWPSISIEKKFYDTIKDTSVKAEVSFLLRFFRLGAASSIKVAGDTALLPGNARCLSNMSNNWLHCFSALKRPRPVFIMAELPNSDCSVTKEATAQESWAVSPATYWDLGADTGAEFDLSPIQDFSVGLSRFYFFEDHDIRLPVCSGTQLLVSKPEFQYSVRDKIDLGEIRLANYHPTYPRKIVPPVQRPAPGAPSNELSRNSLPALVPSKFKCGPH